MSLYDIAHEDLAAFAQMLSLPTSSMEPTYQPDTVRPSGSWLAAQAMLVDQLPEGLLWRNSPRKWALRASQIAKKVAMGMSGAGEALAAAAAAQEGVHMEAHQQSRKAPTVLCPAHEKLNPILVRQMFHYLTREAADCADPVRRHARHRQKKPSHSHRHHHRRLDDGGEACRSRVLRDWGNRLLGLCALWCDQETFAELEQGTLGCRRSRRRFGRTPRSRGVAVRRLQYRQRMPHLALPCEVCVLAAVAAQSSALIDLHASMLSRLALEDYGWEREARKGRHVDTAATQQNPHLWAVVQAWIDAFGPDEAAEIRRRGEALARDLFLVRRCEWQRRRRLDQEMHGRHHRHIHPRYHTGGDCNDHSCPARMATKYGHRLPLPFLALGEDSWPLADKMGEEEVVMEELGGRQPSQGPVLATTRAPQMTYCTSKPLPVLSPDEQEQVLTQLMDEMLAEQRRQGPAATAAVDDSVEVGGKEWLHDWDEAYRQEMYETFMPMAGVPEDQDSYYENTTYEAVPPQARPEHKSRRPAAPAQASSSAYSHRTSTSKEPRLDRATREAAGAARSKRAPEKAKREMRAPPAKESRSSATPATRHSTRPSRTTHSTHSATPATSSRSHDGTSTVTPDDSISRVAERKRREEDRKRREEERHVREEERLQREKRRREREERRAREEREEREERQARQARQSKGKGKEPERRSRTVETTRPSSSRHGTHGSRPSHHPRASTDETKRSSGRQ